MDKNGQSPPNLYFFIIQYPPLYFQIFHRSVSLCRAASVLFDFLLPCALILLEHLHFFAIHVLRHLICLPFLEAEPQSFMRIIFIVSLVFVILDSDEVRVDGVRVERKGDESIDGRRFRDDLERPGLLNV